MIRVQSEDFDISTELAALTAGKHGIGGAVSFVGLVRDMAPGGDSASGTQAPTSLQAQASFQDQTSLQAMTLEHYPGMTEQKLDEIEAEANRRWTLDASLIVHRYGRLEPGEQIVLVICASAHRQAAFDACNFLMDWLKTEAPFWKLEDTGAGANWVQTRASDDAAKSRWNQHNETDAAE